MADADSPSRSNSLKSAPSHLSDFTCSETTGSNDTSPSEPKPKRARPDTSGDAALARRWRGEGARPRKPVTSFATLVDNGRSYIDEDDDDDDVQVPRPPPPIPVEEAHPLLPWPGPLGDDRRAAQAPKKPVNAGAASLGRAARAARDALSKGAAEFLLDATRVQSAKDQFRSLEKASQAYLEADEPELKHCRSVEKALERLHETWGGCDPDDQLRSLASRSAVKRGDDRGFLDRCKVRRCAHLPGQYEAIATQKYRGASPCPTLVRSS